MTMRLIIANKLYSSWSMRPWLLMHALEIPFSDEVIALRRADTKTEIGKWSPSGKLPVLVDDGVVVWESLAIISYLSQRFPDKKIWPDEPGARALALSICHEMHGGFQALRQACPMNLGKRFAARNWDEDVSANVTRISNVWLEARALFGNGGDFLFGEFGAADAMFAPIVCRLDGYSFDVAPGVRDYMDKVLAHPSYLAWRAQAFKEPWLIPEYETGHEVVDVFYAPAGMA